METTTPPPATVAAGASPLNPHTHVKVIDEASELFGKVCRIVETSIENIVVEFESAGSYLKRILLHKQVAVVPTPPASAPAVVDAPVGNPSPSSSSGNGDVAPKPEETSPSPEAEKAPQS